MRFASLGSGSEGNATLIAAADTCLLLDCGFSLRALRQRLAVLQLDLQDLQALLVTHEHSDHCRGVLALAKAAGLPVYATAGTAQSRWLAACPGLVRIEAGDVLRIGALRVTAHGVPHDAREPVQFTFQSDDLGGQPGKRLGILTDLGSFTAPLIQAYRSLDALVIEANHDPEMLARGSYPQSLKERVAGFWGHLSNAQCADFVEQVWHPQLQHLVVAHVSQKNNHPDKIRALLAPWQTAATQLHITEQDSPSPWWELALPRMPVITLC